MFGQLVQEIKEKLFNLDITQVGLFLYTVFMLLSIGIKGYKI